MSIHIPLPENVKNIIQELNDHGYSAYAVGGCVRDVLLGRNPDDWDITTQALPSEVKKIFPRTIDTGIAHGTVTILIDRETYEVTTFRSDGVYLDGRHPKSVTYVPNLKEDLLRRDFTINAMAYDEKEGLIDLYGGLEDLKIGRIRCVGVPTERFTEDALRMLRAVRFSAQLGFTIDPVTENAMAALSSNIRLVSRERIQAELIKLLLSDHPDYWRTAVHTGIQSVILPRYGTADNLSLVSALPKDRILRLAGFLDHLSVEEVHLTLRELKFDNEAVHQISALAAMRELELSPDPVEIRRAISVYGNLLTLHWTLCEARIRTTSASESNLQEIAELRLIHEKILESGDCTSIKDLAINGQDLLSLGIPKGEAIGTHLKKALDIVLSDPQKNTRETLLDFIKETAGL